INEVQFRLREISFVGLGSFDGEEWVVLPPENQHPWLSTAEVFMPTAIERDIRLIVVKKIELDCGITRTIEEELVHRVGIRADSFSVSNTMCVLKHGHFLRQEIPHRLLSLRVAIGPERLHRVECAANPLHVRIAVLNDDAANGIWMFRGNPVTDGCAVVLNIDAELLQAEVFEEQLLDVRRQVVEGIFEIAHTGGVAVTKAYVIGSDDVE